MQKIEKLGILTKRGRWEIYRGGERDDTCSVCDEKQGRGGSLLEKQKVETFLKREGREANGREDNRENGGIDRGRRL